MLLNPMLQGSGFIIKLMGERCKLICGVYLYGLDNKIGFLYVKIFISLSMS
jgi:hypothetical protein